MFRELLASQGSHLEHLVPFHRLIEILPKALERGVLLDAAPREFGAALLALRLVVFPDETLVVVCGHTSLPRRGSGVRSLAAVMA